MRRFILSTLFLLFALFISLAVGSVFLPPSDLFAAFTGHGSQLATSILWKIRLPRTVLIALTGMSLGGSGAAYQGLFRNPLADPYLLGVASGAGLGAVIAMSVKWSYTFWGLMIVPLAAFIGALLTVAIVYLLAHVGKVVPTTTLILAGVTVSSFAVSLTSFLMLRSEGELRRAMSWLMGGSIQLGWASVVAMLPYLAIGLAFILLNGHSLNLLQFGDEQAQQLGLNISFTKKTLLVAASLATAAAVSFAGIIGFIGLVVPHLIRLWAGPDYRQLLPLAVLGGGTVLLFSDVLARVVLSPQEVPVGIITALAGAPFFLWVLRRTKHRGVW
ncbi:MAG: iron ABC transporter permease [Chloroflexi bacterium]|nr:iron ABC transporter permease [Chloroflexota bacterium]